MSSHPFQVLQPEYESWVAHCRPLPGRAAEIDSVARRLTRPDAIHRLGLITDQTQIPQVVQAPIGERECGFDFSKNWAQGDPLTHPSTHVPKGRPPLGAPPNNRFPVTWGYAALDAFTVCDQMNVLSVPAWSLPYACWKWEFYNGGGYRARGLRTPYVLGGTNLQQPGKYVEDGDFKTKKPDGSPLYDSQLGCLPIALRMIELVPSLAFGQAIAVATAPPIVPDVTPLPVAVGGSLTGTKWVQQSLNLVDNADLNVDGSFGRVTRAAIRHFMPSSNGLISDELCNALDKALAARTAKQ